MSKNIFVEEIKFLTLEEVKNSSRIFKNIDNDEIKIFISQAEKIVQHITGRVDFWNPTPTEIKQATLLIAECLYRKKDNKWFSDKIIKSEKRRGNEVTYATENEVLFYKKIHPCLTADIYILLNPFIENNKIWSTFFRT